MHTHVLQLEDNWEGAQGLRKIFFFFLISEFKEVQTDIQNYFLLEVIATIAKEKLICNSA